MNIDFIQTTSKVVSVIRLQVLLVSFYSSISFRASNFLLGKIFWSKFDTHLIWTSFKDLDRAWVMASKFARSLFTNKLMTYLLRPLAPRGA